MIDNRIDAFLGGRLQIEQPAQGYRAGADAVMLAAACPARPGQAVLELGCGAGAALLCLGARVPDLHLTGVERDPGYAAFARANAMRNSQNMQVFNADIAALPPDLRARNFDHVIMNPPFFQDGTPAPLPSRADARHEATPLPDWLDAALRRLRPGGHVTLIHLASRLDAILTGLSRRAGEIVVLPIAARTGREAGRVIVRARKESRTPMRLLAPFIMHAAAAHEKDGEDFTEAAQAVLRMGMPLALGVSDKS